jgi:hypothetical protein
VTLKKTAVYLRRAAESAKGSKRGGATVSDWKLQGNQRVPTSRVFREEPRRLDPEERAIRSEIDRREEERLARHRPAPAPGGSNFEIAPVRRRPYTPKPIQGGPRDPEPGFEYSQRVFLPEHQPVIQSYVDRLAELIERQRRGPISDKLNRELAALLRTNPDRLLNLAPGTALPSEELYRMKATLDRATEGVVSKRSEVIASLSDATPRGQARTAQLEAELLERAAVLSKLVISFHGVKSEAGRSLGFFSREQATTEHFLMRARRHLLDDVRLTADQREQLLTRLLLARDPLDVARIVSRTYLPTLWDKFVELRIMFLLSSPVTIARNAIGNGFGLATRLVEGATGVAVDAAYDVLPGRHRPGLKRAPIEIAADVYGTMEGVIEGSRLFWRALRDETFASTYGRPEEQLLVRHAIKGGPLIVGGRQVPLSPRIQGATDRAQDAAGPWIRTPGRMQAAVDIWFSTINRMGLVHRLAARQAVNEGVVSNARWSRMRELADEAQAVHVDAVQKAIERVVRAGDSALRREVSIADLPADQRIAVQAELGAREFTYRSPLGDFAKRVDMVRLSDTLGGRTFRMLVPFFPTPVNLAKFTVQRMPVVGLVGPRNASAIARGSREALIDALTRQTLGAAVFAPLVLLAAQGYISADPPRDRSAREALRNGTGWQPWSVYVDGVWRSIKGFSPLTEVLGTAAVIAKVWMQRGEIPNEELGARYALSALRIWLDQPFLTGVTDLFDAFRDDNYAEQRASNIASSFIASSVVPRGVAFLARALDPTLREYPGDLRARIAQDLPIVRERELPFLDPLGRVHESPNAVLHAIVPSREARARSPLDAMLWEIREEDDRAIVNYPSRTFLGRRLDPVSYSRYLQARGELLVPRLERLAANRRFRAADPAIQRKLVQRLEEEANKAARARVLVPAELESLGLAPTPQNRRAMARTIGTPILAERYRHHPNAAERLRILATGQP